MDHLAKVEVEIVALHEEHAASLTRFAFGLTHCEDLAKDAVQETFLRYFVERRFGRVIERPRAWLFQVLRNHVLDRMSSGAATREVVDAGLDEISDPEADPEDLAQRSEIARAISAVLSLRERECMGLRYEGFSYIEIAGLMGLKIGTVGALLTRAHQKIRVAAGNSGAGETHVACAVHELFHGGAPCPSA